MVVAPKVRSMLNTNLGSDKTQLDIQSKEGVPAVYKRIGQLCTNDTDQSKSVGP